MGGTSSTESFDTDPLEEFCNPINRAKNFDVGIDETLLLYSGTQSLAVLSAFNSVLQNEAQHLIPDYVEKFGAALAGFAVIPHAVGVGALVISMIIQLAIKGSSTGKEGPANIPRRVFAEEKALEVRDLMDEYVKRYKMNLRDDRLLLDDTRRLEESLSLQLTRLKNSMLQEGHMNSRSLKHWANGAAFHTLMLIHMVRLQKRDRRNFYSAKSKASTAINIYNADVLDLVQKYREYKRLRIYRRYWTDLCLYRKDDRVFEYYMTERCKLPLKWCITERDLMDQLYDGVFYELHPHIGVLKNYFFNLQNNLEVLVYQEDTFSPYIV